MTAATAQGLIAKNPCQIIGAGTVRHAERPLMAPEVLDAIVTAMPVQWMLPIRVMFGAHLRVGELVALQRSDYAGGVLRVERQMIRVRGEFITTPTKTRMVRSVALPPSIVAELEAYLAASTSFPKSPMFPRADGQPITGNALGQAWRKAARMLGHGRFHVHDVRHAGLTMAAQGGATTRELMARAGHSTPRAALIYQHAAEERNLVIAATLDVLSGRALDGGANSGAHLVNSRELPGA
ncbi:MAG: site-specific integrase [Actinobacteria bacterium]|nr:site-specific integrase [Actinomycetota bacterium]